VPRRPRSRPPDERRLALPFLLIAIVLGLVEGLTEFVPVSSTGHLILAGHLLGFTGDKSKAFEVFIQLGAILAVVWESRAYLAQTGADLVKGGMGSLISATAPSPGRRMVLNLALAFLPAAIAGLALHHLIEERLFAPGFVAIGLLAGGAGILIVESTARAPRVHDVDSVPWTAALGVGLAQCLSLFPGVSRSAATILGGMAAGLDRKTATRFSFLLAIPTMLAASLYSLYHWRHVLEASDAPGFAAGFIVAFAAGLATVKLLLRYVATHDFRPFAWYRLALGLIVLWLLGAW
jgi:undecaprenyl-diphosphatase